MNRPLGGRGPEARTEGITSIADGVVAKVAGIAAREVAGVYALGGGGARAFGAIRDAVNATDLTQGVKVEVGETQAAVDVTIVVEYGAQIQEVADQVRARIAGSIEHIVDSTWSRSMSRSTTCTCPVTTTTTTTTSRASTDPSGAERRVAARSRHPPPPFPFSGSLSAPSTDLADRKDST